MSNYFDDLLLLVCIVVLRRCGLLLQTEWCCLSAGLSVTIVSPAKMAEPFEMPFGLWTLVGPRKGKEEYLYSAFSHQGTYKALRHGSHSFTCK